MHLPEKKDKNSLTKAKFICDNIPELCIQIE